MDVIEQLARQIAEEAHAGKVDKLGEPYIGHVSRVAGRLDDPLDRAVAWLHDVVEDTDWTVVSLLNSRYQLPTDCCGQTWSDVVWDVKELTHRPHEPRSDYYARIRTSERAVRVKLADIADNSDPARLARLDEATRKRLKAKYAKAQDELTN